MAFVNSLPLSSLKGINRSTHARTHLSFISPQRSPFPFPAKLKMCVTSTGDAKKALLEELMPLNFGRSVIDNPERMQEIEHMIQKIEATNKSLNPCSDPNLFGVWDMVFTTSKGILNVRTPSFLQSTRIVQQFNAEELNGQNAEEVYLGPLKLTNVVNLELKPVSPNRIDVNFVQFVVCGFLKFNVRENKRFTGWLEVTYLDDDMRISRGHLGNVFVLVKK